MKHTFILWTTLWTLASVGSLAQDRLVWSELPPLPDAHGFAGPFVGVHQDTLIVAGGANFPNQPLWETAKVWHQDIFSLDAAKEAWTPASKLPRALAYGAAVSTPDGVLCLGGDDAQRVYADVFRLSVNAETKQITISDFPPLPTPVAYGGASLVGSTVYLVAGQTGKTLASATNAVWTYDLAQGNQGQWIPLENVPWSNRAFVQVASQHNGWDDCLYVIGGRRLGDNEAVEFLNDVWEYHPNSQIWRQRKSLEKPLMAGTAIGYGQSHIMVLGGADGSFWGRENDLLDDHPGFPKRTYLYHTITDTWFEAGESPRNHVTTIPVKWQGDVVIASGEVRPRVRSPKVWKVSPVKLSGEFGTLNYTVLIIYLLAMVGVGGYWARRNKGTDDYFRGGKKIVWWAAGCSIFATMLSSLTFTALPSKSYAQNWAVFMNNMMIPVVAIAAVYIALPFYRRIDATSAYEYLEMRFSRLIRQLGSAFFTLFHIFRMGIVMSLTGLALSVATGISPSTAVIIMGLLSVLYSTMGGVEAVVWTDTIQTIVLLGGAILAFLMLMNGIAGGFSGFVSIATEADKFRLANLHWDITSAQAALWVIILGGIGQNLSTYTADQAVVQRYMTTPTEKLAARSIWTNAILSTFASILFFALGSALFAFYASNPSHLDPTINTDQVFPLFIANEMPAGLAGLIVAGIFAAAQSTVSTSLNSTATTLVVDFLKPLNLCQNDQGYLRAARLITMGMGILGVVFGLVFVDPEIKSLFDQFIKIVGLVLGVLGGLFLLGVLSQKANASGALIGVISGVALTVWIWKGTAINGYFYPFVAFTSCYFIGWLASLLVPGQKNTENLTIHSLRRLC